MTNFLQVDPRESSKSQKSYEEAEDLFDDEEYEAALDKFSEAMLLSPVKVERVQDRGKIHPIALDLRWPEMGSDQLFFVRISLIPTKPL